MRSRAFIVSILATGAIVAGCTFSDLASYEVAGDDGGASATDPGAPSGSDGGPDKVPEGGASSCTDDTGATVAVGASVPCTATETGAAIVFPLAGDPRGTCKRGRKTCTSTGKFDHCVGAVGPAKRDCSSPSDNDCNGVVDSTECTGCVKMDKTQATIGGTDSCFDFPLPAHSGVGVCKPGTWTCKVKADKSGLEWGPCAGEVGPATTGPNDLSCGPTADDNCNGKPAEGCKCTDGVDFIVCGDCSQTKVTCAGGTYPACPPAGSNVYNGVAVGGACSGGTGACYRSGTVVCPAGGGPATCSSLPVSPGARNCASSTDNDCNGLADNAESVCKCNGTVGVGASAGCGLCGGSATCNSQGSTVAFGACSAGPPVPKDHAISGGVTFTDGSAQNSQVGTWGPPGLPGFAGSFTITFNLSQQGNVDNTHGAGDANGPAAEVGCSTNGANVLLGSADFGHGGPGVTRQLTCPAGSTVYVKKRTNWGGGCCGGYTRTVTFTSVNYTDC